MLVWLWSAQARSTCSICACCLIGSNPRCWCSCCLLLPHNCICLIYILLINTCAILFLLPHFIICHLCQLLSSQLLLLLLIGADVPVKAPPSIIKQLLHPQATLAQQDLLAQQRALLSRQAGNPAPQIALLLARTAWRVQLLYEGTLLLHENASSRSCCCYGLLQLCLLFLVADQNIVHLMQHQLLLLTSCTQIQRHHTHALPQRSLWTCRVASGCVPWVLANAQLLLQLASGSRKPLLFCAHINSRPFHAGGACSSTIQHRKLKETLQLSQRRTACT